MSAAKIRIYFLCIPTWLVGADMQLLRMHLQSAALFHSCHFAKMFREMGARAETAKRKISFATASVFLGKVRRRYRGSHTLCILSRCQLPTTGERIGFISDPPARCRRCLSSLGIVVVVMCLAIEYINVPPRYMLCLSQLKSNCSPPNNLTMASRLCAGKAIWCELTGSCMLSLNFD